MLSMQAIPKVGAFSAHNLGNQRQFVLGNWKESFDVSLAENMLGNLHAAGLNHGS
jgi:hypothetical protein